MTGQTIAQYEILDKLGEGGMGVVYRAKDTKLGREVAIKVLPPSVAGDPERMARFKREAHVLASLNHPHIASIYGLEESDGVRGLVMELVEGPTLADRIAEGPISLEEALPLARQMAEALEYAHEKGIVHRDLKPANVKLTTEGEVKVLDFGLAKAAEETVQAGSPETSPTLTLQATRAGVIMGTAAYMSPEQASGKPVERRADIWSFGVVLWEMLTGQRLFSGETISHTLAAVLTKDPDWEQLPAETPASIRRLLRRCLERDGKKRLRDIGEARIAIEEQLADPAGASVLMEAPAIAPQPTRWRVLPWALAGVLVVALVASLVALRRAIRPAEQPLMQFNVDLGLEAALGVGFGASTILSPDGTRLVFVSRGSDGKTMLYTRQLGQPQATALASTENARSPFFSPDGQRIGFVADSKLKKVSVQGGAAVTLCEAPYGLGGTWGDDGNIIAALNSRGGLSRVSAGGGTPESVTELNEETGENSHRWPQVLLGGRAVLFTAGIGGNWDEASIEVHSLETGKRKTLHRGGSYGRYLPSGHLVYVHQGTLFAAPMDLDRLELTGPPEPVLEGVANTGGGGAQLDFSQTGMFVYFSGQAAGLESSILWLDSTGQTHPLLASPGNYRSPHFSPVGERLALAMREGANWNLSIYEWERDTMSQLTFDPEADTAPVWHPDGRHIAFASERDGGVRNIYWTRADGAGQAQRLTESKNAQRPNSFSPDGKRLAFHENSPETGWDIWTLPIEGDPDSPQHGEAELFLATPAGEVFPAFSPDGRWLAYQSSESGTGRYMSGHSPAPEASG